MTDGKGRPPSRRPIWLAWLAVSALAWGGILAIIFLVPSWEWAYVPVSEEHFWIHRLRFEVMPAVGIIALIAPVAGLVALLLRRWRPVVLGLCVVVAVAQFAYVGLEKYLQTVELSGPSLPEGWEDFPVVQSPGGPAR